MPTGKLANNLIGQKAPRNTPEFYQYTEIVDILYPEPPRQPEKGLLAAVLERAIADALGALSNCEEAQKQRRRAYSWIVYSSLDSEDPKPFTYQWVCSNLEFDPLQIRSALIAARKANLKFERQGRKKNGPKTLILCK